MERHARFLEVKRYLWGSGPVFLASGHLTGGATGKETQRAEDANPADPKGSS